MEFSKKLGVINIKQEQDECQYTVLRTTNLSEKSRGLNTIKNYELLVSMEKIHQPVKEGTPGCPC